MVSLATLIIASVVSFILGYGAALALTERDMQELHRFRQEEKWRKERG